MAACGEDGERPGGDAGGRPEGTATPTASPDELPGGELVRCESPEGFVIGRPESWSTNSGEVVPACSRLNPEPFDVPEGTDERVAAVTASIDPVPFAEVASPGRGRDADRAATTIDGLQAVRLEHETTEDALWPPGTPITVYAVDLSPGADGQRRTLLVDTVGLEGFDYERNQVVLDRVARSVDVTLDDVPTDPAVVARYEGGGGGFRVEGDVSADEACLRIPPRGEPVCTDRPERDQVHTIQLTDIQPVLAGVTGDAVFRVVAERRNGDASTVLPAPIGDSGVRGFAFTFGLGSVSRLRLFDVTGDELRVVEPGG